MGYPAPSPRYIGPPNHHGGTGNKPIKRIVIHATVSACATGADDIARYFKTTDRYASAHYVVDADNVFQSCYDSWIAYHAPPNEHSIGVELCCTLSNQGKGHWGDEKHKAMLRRAARLVAELCLAYDVPANALSAKSLRAGKHGICSHNAVGDAWGQTTHWDPGPYFPWRLFIRMVREEIEDIKDGDKTHPRKRNTKVRRARRAFAEGLDLLAGTAAGRKRVKRIAKHIEDDVHALPKQ